MSTIDPTAADLLAALGIVPITPIAWADFRAEVLALYDPDANLAAKKTYKKLEHVLNAIEGIDLAGEGKPRRTIQTTADLSPLLVARSIAAKLPGRSPHTVQSYLSSLRAACTYAQDRRYLAVSPFVTRKMGRWIRAPRPAGKRHLGRDEIRRLLDRARQDAEERTGWGRWRSWRLYAVLATAALTGARAGEVFRLWVEDIDLEGSTIWVRPRGKSLKTPGSEAPIAIPRQLAPILGEWLSKHRLSRPRGFKLPDHVPHAFPCVSGKAPWTSGYHGTKPLDRLKALGVRAGVPVVTFQMLRRSFCTHAEAAGVPRGLIARQARHSSQSVTEQWYLQADLDNLRAALGGFSY